MAFICHYATTDNIQHRKLNNPLSMVLAKEVEASRWFCTEKARVCFHFPPKMKEFT